MKLIFTKLFFCCNFFFVSNISVGQTKFYASATPTKAGIDEYITYTLTIENGTTIEQVNHPEFSDFITVSGPNQSSSKIEINGKVTRSVSISFILQPKKSGNFLIAASNATINGEVFKSNVVSVSISNKKSGNKNPQVNISSPFAVLDFFDEPKPQKKYQDYILQKGETVQENVNRNMQLRLQTDKTSCYVGEPILATYKLYTRLQSESNVSKNPSFNGFSVIDMMPQIDQSSNNHEKINGREYNVYVIRKAQLYPLQTGVIELEAATLDNKITFIRNDNGVNNMLEENVSITNKPLTIQVNPLPEVGKPENFKDAVGNFNIESSVEKNNFTTDETGKLFITISGKGNMQLLTLPEINWPSEFEVYETKITDNTNNLTIPISGSKTFEIPFTVTAAGKYNIPQIKFSYFDPSMGSYKMVFTKSIEVNITKGNGIATSSAIKVKKEKPVSFLNKIFLNRWLVILFLAGIIIVSFIFWVGRERKQEEKKILPNEKKNINYNEISVDLASNINHLTKTEHCLAKEDCVDFYTLLNSELKQFMAKRFVIDKETVNAKTLGTILDKENIDNKTSLEIQQLFQEIEWQLYTPFERSQKLQEMYARAQTIIQVLSKQPLA